MTNEHAILGNEVANEDLLLYDCKVNNTSLRYLPLRIIIGKWGAGKSAALILKAHELAKKLKSLHPDLEPIWYITENQLDFPVLFKEFESSADEIAFRKYLERIWLAEILRRTILLLGNLDEYYGYKEGLHWDFIRAAFNGKKLGETLWKQLPNVFKIIKKIDNDQAAALTEITESVGQLFKTEAYRKVQACLKDIEDYSIQPFIAIEPLEQPDSDLDKQINLAQEVVNSLINVFQENFQPNEEKTRLQVYMALPWHRYQKRNANLSHHLQQYCYHLHWDKEIILNLINQRISWEFERIKRRNYDKANPWNSLFVNTVTRKNFNPPIIENSFSYILRHTHYRPRDIIRIVRLAIIVASEKNNQHPDLILEKHQISYSEIRTAIHRFRSSSFDDLRIEMKRRFNNDFEDILNIIIGLPCMFKQDTLSKRIKNNDNVYSFEQIFNTMWESGIFGIEAKCIDKAKEKTDLESLLPKKNQKIDKNQKQEEVIRWYFFEYNYEENPISLLKKFENSDIIDVHIVFHPKTLNYLPGNNVNDWPIGI